MVILDDKPYHEAVAIVLSQKKRNGIAEKLYLFAKEKFDINIINYTYCIVDKRRRLGIILKSDKEYDFMHRSRFVSDPQKDAIIASNFNKILKSYPSIKKFDIEKDFVSYYNLQDEAIVDANWKTNKKYRDTLKNDFSEIWEILPIFRSTTVFYTTDLDVSKYNKSGLSRKIHEAYYRKIKEFDLLKYLNNKDDFAVNFDSKENLDKNYQGSLFYYSR